MDVLIYLIPAALFLGLLGLCAFLWSLRKGQYEDLDGAAERILFDEEETPGKDPDRTGRPN
ncbi:cbb3-type cytochrome oxidase assembly protein CcoS [Algihabitans albus]|uniref:cbb3-type cytochrome oxidase assembly protein CcoS n=1 Tax=Algihabitans albus TaxID=2164067 RepID=UPI0035CF6B3C